MLDVTCDYCGKPLTEPGALMFSPPDPRTRKCTKIHVCAPCWYSVEGWAGKAGSSGGEASDPERIYPCDRCGKMRTKAEGGTVFTVCDACWDAAPKASEPSFWRCETCSREVHPIEVTYEELRDPRAGGCGHGVGTRARNVEARGGECEKCGGSCVEDPIRWDMCTACNGTGRAGGTNA